MKKISLFTLLGASLLLVGCGNNEQGVVQQDVCEKYFSVLECINVSQVPEEQQEDVRVAIGARRDQLNALSEEERTATCTAVWETEIVAQSELYESFGCSIE